MKKRYCIIPQILLLFWFFLNMTGIYFRNTYLVARSYKDDGIFFLIYLVTIILFIFKEKFGKWAVRNGIKEAYRDITGKVTTEDVEEEQIRDELGIDEEEK